MKPPKREYEKVPTDDFVTGVIEDYQYEEEHDFKGPDSKKGPAVRFKFVIDGLQYPKHSSWMTFSYAEKSNLYSKYLVSLVANAKANMDFDLDQVKGMKVKMLWKDNPKNPAFQGVDSIRPIGEKISALVTGDAVIEEEIPF